ncbi:arsenate reductase ArsC [Rhizobium laguerreae]|uniref:arsenate reductase ArsC n=1 Tax=Rhizobium laguerreae TaxID=1076926 RepID=UPI001C911F9A|nr:arsenate reductase ArsC [Rhizobium laguerreae]MBY3246140.1 arsenate reductase ArsC [Rhizobium laguerreae]MBY3252781.1 arsenate reductase ArsC [Rhizobium laguerreae]
MTKTTFNVLFLCTGNSARSVLAESILRKDGAGKFVSYSAGSTPKGEVNPLAIEVLDGYGYPTDGLRSKSWDEFATPDAPQLDFVFTVCDNAAGEACPIWPGQPMSAHWGIDDPAAVEGTPLERKAAFVQAFKYMKARITAFAALPVESLEHISLTAKLKDIGEMDGTTSRRSDVA